MTWIHCLNCGWQGERNSGKIEKAAGVTLIVAGVAAAIILRHWPLPAFLIVAGVIGLLVGLGAGAQLNCPHCASTDIKKYKPSIDSK